MKARKLIAGGGFDANVRERRDDRPALTWAATSGAADLVLDLIAAGARVNGGGVDGFALFAAIGNAQAEIARILVDAGAKLSQRDRNGLTVLMRAVALGDLALVRLLLSKGVDVNARDKDGNSALLLAAASRRKRIERDLLEAGARTRVTNRWGLSYSKLAKGEPVPRWMRL